MLAFERSSTVSLLIDDLLSGSPSSRIVDSSLPVPSLDRYSRVPDETRLPSGFARGLAAPPRKHIQART